MSSRKTWFRVVVWLMLASMVLSVVLAAASFLFTN